VNKKPPQLPNIEDATLQACLAPLMEAMHAIGEPVVVAAPLETARVPPKDSANSNDKPAPLAAHQPGNGGVGVAKSLAEWRSLAEGEFGVFRTIELFLTMTDVELEAVAAEFPRQIAGTVARIAAIKQRLTERYDMVTTIMALLERARARAAAGGKGHAATEQGAGPDARADSVETYTNRPID